jgi:hypothetical protein
MAGPHADRRQMTIVDASDCGLWDSPYEQRACLIRGNVVNPDDTP